MIAGTDNVLDMEDGEITKVRCLRCGEYIGRVQVVPPEGDDPVVWEQEVPGELDLLAHEHESECPNTLTAAD